MTAADRILWHAGLSLATDASDSLAALTADGDAGEVEAAASDFIAALDEYNRELNGPVPSERIDGADEYVPRRLTYAAGEVGRMLRVRGLSEAALRVETAWLAVLAGDIDDIPAHLAEEGIR